MALDQMGQRDRHLPLDCWIVVSIGFSWYPANFGTYNETYGSLGAVIGFMVWLWLSTIVIFLGAELDAEMEHQTARDTTTGAPKSMGMRGATMADTVGPASDRHASPAKPRDAANQLPSDS
jgi:membrane protein